jgi:NADH-quinone oxidoreductase subunit H
VFFVGDQSATDEAERDATPQGYDGGFPVPPMPSGGPVRGAAATLTFDTGRTVAAVEEDS